MAAAVSWTGSASLASHWTGYAACSQCKAAKRSPLRSTTWIGRTLAPFARHDELQHKGDGRQIGVLNVATVEAETATEARTANKETYTKSPITSHALEAQRIVQQLQIGRHSGRALEEILGPLMEQLCDKRTLGLVMKELGHKRWGATASKVLHFLRSAGRTPDTRAHSEVLRALGRAGQSDACVALLNEMTSCGPPPDVWCYSEVLKALAGEEKFEQVLVAFEEMNERRVAPSIWCYNIVVAALCKGGSFREARALLQQMRGGPGNNLSVSGATKMGEKSKLDKRFTEERKEFRKGAQVLIDTSCGTRLKDESTAAKGVEEKMESQAQEALLAEGQRSLGAAQGGGDHATAGKQQEAFAPLDPEKIRAGATFSGRKEGSISKSKGIRVSLKRGSGVTQLNGSQHSKASRTAELQKASQPRAHSFVRSEQRFKSTESLDREKTGEAVGRESRREALGTSDQNVETSAQEVEATVYRAEVSAQQPDTSSKVRKALSQVNETSVQRAELAAQSAELAAQSAETSAHSLVTSVQAAERPAQITETFAQVKETSAQSARTSVQKAGPSAHKVEIERSAKTTTKSATEHNGLEVLRRAILGHRGNPAAGNIRESGPGLKTPGAASLGEVSLSEVAPPQRSECLDVGSLHPDEVVVDKQGADLGSNVFVGADRFRNEPLSMCTEGKSVEDRAFRSSGREENSGQTRAFQVSQIPGRDHLRSSGIANGVRFVVNSNNPEAVDESVSSSPLSSSVGDSFSNWTATDSENEKPGISQGCNSVTDTKSAHSRKRSKSAKLRWRGLNMAEEWPPAPAPDAVTYNVVIGACADQSDGWRTAVELLRCMKEDSIQPTRITYNSVLIACSRAGQWRHCLDCWNALEAAKLARDDFALSCVVRALGAVKRCKKAVEMVQAARRGAFGRECRPSVQTCNMVITACSQQKQWQAAVAFLRWMQKETNLAPDVNTYNAAVQACMNAGEAQQALQLYSELLQVGLRPDSHSQTLYIRTLSSCGRHVAALDAFWAFRSGPGVSSTITYNATIVACGRGLLWLDAFKVFQDMDSSNIAPNLVTYEALIKALCDCGEVEKARAVFQAMGPRGFKPRVRTFNNLLHGYAQENRWEESRAIFDSMLRFGVRPDTISYNILMRAYRRGGQFQAVVSMFVSMQEPDDVTFREVLIACDGGGLGAEAMWALERMDAWGIVPGEFHYARALVASARGGAWEDVEELYQYMRGEGMELDGTIFMAMLARLEVEGSTERAQELLAEWRETANDFEIGPGGYNLVLGAFGSAGKWQEALDWKEVMVARGITPNVTTFSMLIGVLEKCGRWKEAMAVFGQMPMTGGVVEPTKQNLEEEF